MPSTNSSLPPDLQNCSVKVTPTCIKALQINLLYEFDGEECEQVSTQVSHLRYTNIR